MTALQPLAALLAQSERERDLALAEQQRAQSASDAADAQAKQLLDYRREYEQRWGAQFSREGRIELVRCYQSFVERLTLAVDQQARIAEHAKQQLANAVVALRAAETRCASVRKLIERRTAELRVVAGRREQQQTDESAARAAWGRLDPNGRSRAAG
jgi:flagellar FliJ protein